jgi:hypothetical protein
LTDSDKFSGANISPWTFDATDLRLLDLLQTDASLSNQALAEQAGTSPATACAGCGGWWTKA